MRVVDEDHSEICWVSIDRGWSPGLWLLLSHTGSGDMYSSAARRQTL